MKLICNYVFYFIRMSYKKTLLYQQDTRKWVEQGRSQDSLFFFRGVKKRATLYILMYKDLYLKKVHKCIIKKIILKVGRGVRSASPATALRRGGWTVWNWDDHHHASPLVLAEMPLSQEAGLIPSYLSEMFNPCSQKINRHNCYQRITFHTFIYGAYMEHRVPGNSRRTLLHTVDTFILPLWECSSQNEETRYYFYPCCKCYMLPLVNWLSY